MALMRLFRFHRFQKDVAIIITTQTSVARATGSMREAEGFVDPAELCAFCSVIVNRLHVPATVRFMRFTIHVRIHST